MFSPVNIAYAADNSAAFGRVLDPIISNIVMPLVFLAFAIAVLVFAYGVAKMIISPSDAEAYTRGKWSMLGGLIGIFIMVSAWGIIQLVSNTVGQFGN